MQEAKTFREKKLPCDAMIYLGTGFCPAGWNTNNGEFTFNQKVLPDPKAMFDQLAPGSFQGGAARRLSHRHSRDERHGPRCLRLRASAPRLQASCYWDMHRPVLATGVDGWWPDEGDALDLPSRLVRNRMYWEA